MNARDRARALVQSALAPVPLGFWQKVLPKDVVSVCYHMVSDEDVPHCRLYRYKGSAAFERDVVYARDHAVSYAEVAAHRLGGAPLRDNSVLFTFDDGLSECYSIVRPILQRHGVPAVFFVTAGFVDDRLAFHESTLSLCLSAIEGMQRDLLREVDARVTERNGATRSSVTNGRALQRLAGARVTPGTEPEKRRLLLWLLGLPDDDRAALEDACELLDVDPAAYAAGRPIFMRSSEVKALAADGFTIGAHGIDHRSMVGRDQDDVAGEIVSSCATIRDITGQPVVPFAFPYDGVAIDRAFLADVLQRHAFIEMVFDSGSLRRDPPFVVNRVFADSPADVERTNLPPILRAAWSAPSAWYRRHR